MFIRSFRFKACVFISFICFIFSSFTSFALDDTDSQTNTVRIGYYITKDIQDKDQNQNYSGSGYDYYKLIEQYTKWDYEFIESSFVDSLDMLKEGRLDIVGGLVKSNKLDDSVLYTDLPYANKLYQIYTKHDNNSLYYESFEDFDGITIGVLKGNQQIEELELYAEEKGFVYHLLYFDTISQMERALAYRQIDAIFSSYVTEMNKYKIIATLKLVPIYFGVNKNKPHLLKELNSALYNIRDINPHFSEFLQEKYRNKDLHLAPSFTKEEAKYIDTNPLIYVLVKYNWQPLIFYNSKIEQYDGIFVDIFEHISSLTGLEFRFCPTDQKEVVKSRYPNANFVAIINNDFNCANRYNYNISNTVFDTKIVMISKKEVISRNGLSIALPKGSCSLKLIEKDKSKYNYDIIFMDTIKDCLLAVKKGKVHATCLIESTATYYQSTFEYEDLYGTYYNSNSEMLCIGVSQSSDEHLLPIINKTLMCLSEKQLSNIIIKNSYIDQGFSFKAIFYAYPKQTVIIVASISTIIITLLVLAIYNNKAKKEEIKNALLETSLSNERFKVALYQLPCDIIEYDFTNNSLYYLDKLYGTKTLLPLEKKKSLQPFTLCGAVYPEFTSIFDNLYDRVMAGESTIEVTLKGENQQKECWGRFTLTAVYDGTQPIRMIGTLADVTAEICADLDSLTRLYNRGAFCEKVSAEIQNNAPNHFGVFIMMDMDDFKGINDTYGHFAGDTCLVYLANKLKLGFSKKDLVARMGGDEFAVFINGCSATKQAIQKATNVFDSINNTNVVLKDGTTITINISMGIAIYPYHGSDFINLYQNADKALYEAKEANKHQICIYDEH